MINQNQQIGKSNDYANHQWVLSYGEITRAVSFFKSDEYVQEIMNDMLQEHRAKQLEKLINNNEDN